MLEAPIAADRYITEVTRRRLLDGLEWLRGTVPSGWREFLTPAHTFWSGALPETDFLARLYDLDKLPSTDSRYTTAFQDIVQHRVMNEDWDDDWIFHDSRFGLADSDEALLQFLAEMLHPAVRTDPAEVERLHNFLNTVLAHDGYELVQVDDISGAPLFAPRRIGAGVRGTMKNLIFAAIGPKPEIVLIDAVNNDLRITGNAQGCLMYDRPLAAHGLTWAELTAWWADREGMASAPAREVSSACTGGWTIRWATTAPNGGSCAPTRDRYVRARPGHPGADPAGLPALRPAHAQALPARRGTADPPAHGLPDAAAAPGPGGNRVRRRAALRRRRRATQTPYANPRRYAEMVAEDRELRLAGYEVYRFGGVELIDSPDTATPTRRLLRPPRRPAHCLKGTVFRRRAPSSAAMLSRPVTTAGASRWRWRYRPRARSSHRNWRSWAETPGWPVSCEHRADRTSG